MSDRILTLTDLDADGALQDAHEAVGGATRSDFFKKAAIGGGALVASGGVLGALAIPANAAKKSKKNDVAILNYALTLEFLEARFYEEALDSGVLSGDVLLAAQVLSEHENDHVKVLRKTLGKAAVKSPKFDFGDSFSSSEKFVEVSILLEDTGVSAYAGQVGNILQPAVLKAAAAIHSVEARHASRMRTLGGEPFAPNSFDPAKSMKAILKALDGTGFIVG